MESDPAGEPILNNYDKFIEKEEKLMDKDKIEEVYWGYAQLRIKQSFLNFFLLTINNYIAYFKNLDDEVEMSPQMKEKKSKFSNLIKLILDLDKLTSTDIFDFDDYLNQFEPGINKNFIEKLVKTQSFHNFIEDSYKSTSHKNQIGFFKTNMDVIIQHSFKRLKKE